MSSKLIKIINLIFFYLIWWGCILGIRSNCDYVGPILTLVFIAAHLKMVAELKKELILILCCGFLGLTVENLYLYFNFISYEGYLISKSFMPPLWVVCIWIALAMTINHSMVFLKDRWIITVICGAIFGPACYFAVMKFSIIHFHFSTLESIFILSTVCGISLPLMYYINKIIEDKYGI